VSSTAGNDLLNTQGETDDVITKEMEHKQQEYLDTLVKNAELRIEMDNVEMARKNLKQIRSVDPDYPGLSELSQKIGDLKKERMQDAMMH